MRVRLLTRVELLLELGRFELVEPVGLDVVPYARAQKRSHTRHISRGKSIGRKKKRRRARPPLTCVDADRSQEAEHDAEDSLDRYAAAVVVRRALGGRRAVHLQRPGTAKILMGADQQLGSKSVSSFRHLGAIKIWISACRASCIAKCPTSLGWAPRVSSLARRIPTRSR